MNIALVAKMKEIEEQFALALQEMPMSNRQSEVKDVIFDGNTGICIRGSRFIWGITKEEYCTHYNIM